MPDYLATNIKPRPFFYTSDVLAGCDFDSSLCDWSIGEKTMLGAQTWMRQDAMPINISLSPQGELSQT